MKIVMSVLTIWIITLLVACTPIEIFPNETFIHSSAAPELIIDPDLVGFIEMQIDVVLAQQLLIIDVNNNSDFVINLGSQSPNRIRRPSLQYFDGENWRTVSYTHYRNQFDIDEFGLENDIYPNSAHQINLNFENYHLPEEVLFRIVLRARGNDPARGYGSAAQFRHDFFTEFTLENTP